MAKKYQIFVSSTYSDLVAERQAVTHAILDMGHIPAGMELFPAADMEQLTYITKVIDECDYYVLIIGSRYGSVDDHGVSYTEREYDYAVSKRKPVLAFINIDIGSRVHSLREIGPRSLNGFVQRVMQGRLVRMWSTALELKSLAIVALQWSFSEMPQVGWVRADTLPDGAAEKMLRYRQTIDRLSAENSQLKRQPSFNDVADLDKSVSIQYTVIGGTRLAEYGTNLGDALLTMADSLRSGASLDALSRDIKMAIETSRCVSYVIVVEHSLAKIIATLIAANLIHISKGQYCLTNAGGDAWVRHSYYRKDET